MPPPKNWIQGPTKRPVRKRHDVRSTPPEASQKSGKCSEGRQARENRRRGATGAVDVKLTVTNRSGTHRMRNGSCRHSQRKLAIGSGVLPASASLFRIRRTSAIVGIILHGTNRRPENQKRLHRYDRDQHVFPGARLHAVILAGDYCMPDNFRDSTSVGCSSPSCHSMRSCSASNRSASAPYISRSRPVIAWISFSRRSLACHWDSMVARGPLPSASMRTHLQSRGGVASEPCRHPSGGGRRVALVK